MFKQRRRALKIVGQEVEIFQQTAAKLWRRDMGAQNFIFALKFRKIVHLRPQMLFLWNCWQENKFPRRKKLMGGEQLFLPPFPDSTVFKQ